MNVRQTKQREKRNLLSSFFVTLLIGIAYQEMISSVRLSVREFGITLETSILMAVFFLTSMRFFIGNQFHLLSKSLIKMPGLVWFYDLMIIIIQSVVLIFLGGVVSYEMGPKIQVAFIPLLIALYGIDILWIISQWLLGKYLPSWRRESIPWGWAIINSILIAGILSLCCSAGNRYPTLILAGLLGLSLVAFVADVLLMDYADLL